MKFDSTITITVVIAISAIISPIITTLLNNHHLYKMRKLDDETELRKTSYFYKRGIFEDYMRYAGQCVTHATSDALENYGATYALALIYFPDELLLHHVQKTRPNGLLPTEHMNRLYLLNSFKGQKSGLSQIIAHDMRNQVAYALTGCPVLSNVLLVADRYLFLLQVPINKANGTFTCSAMDI